MINDCKNTSFKTKEDVKQQLLDPFDELLQVKAHCLIRGKDFWHLKCLKDCGFYLEFAQDDSGFKLRRKILSRHTANVHKAYFDAAKTKDYQ